MGANRGALESRKQAIQDLAERKQVEAKVGSERSTAFRVERITEGI